LICLGIESTAHTFGASVVELTETRGLRILSDSRDVYKAPDGSGIHPREASRHHIEICSRVVAEALSSANKSVDDLDFISYSAGPGLGPCLRVGAVVARSLGSYFDKPIVAANHAIGHIELGRWLANQTDPLVLLISGGHTAIVAKVDDGWRVFGETLDLTIGQLLDQLGRYFGLSSPAGQKIESLAEAYKQSRKEMLALPYSIKGNDVSYSGLLTAAKDLYSSGASKEAVSFSVQEFAFALLTEATERALAFTNKSELLVTGGVAANKRLASILQNMCDSRNVKLGVIPMRYAGDCGAQIGAAGMLFYKHGQIVEPASAFIRQSWRVDRVNLDDGHSLDSRGILLSTRESWRTPILGAEAKIERVNWFGKSAVRKQRIRKFYRDELLDETLRIRRTKQEAEILHAAKLAGVACPEVFYADPMSSEIIMEYVDGELLLGVQSNRTQARDELGPFFELGWYAARLHRNSIIHGDLTTRNIILRRNNELVLIDFGLSFLSDRLEDKAEDLHLLKQALKSTESSTAASKHFDTAIRGYQKEVGSTEADRVRGQIAQIELRGRYARVD
jgi:Kae1-associated kinase Bud32